MESKKQASSDTDEIAGEVIENNIQSPDNEKQPPEPIEPPEPTESEPEHQYISGAHLFMVMTCIVLVGFIMLLDSSIIGPAVPRITDEFHSLQDIGWYASSYQLGSAALQPLTGKIYSHFSSKWSFLGFFAIFEIGSLICGAATSSTMLIVGRAVAGMGTSGLMNGSFTIIAGSVPLNKRAALTGMLIGVAQIGVVCGPLIGGALTEYATWRWCFYINLPIGAAIAVLMLFNRIPDQIKKPDPRTVLRQLHRKLDLVGFVLFAPAAIQLLLALQYGGHAFPWKSATVIGLFCGSAANFLVWGVWNYRRGDDALIPVSMARKRAVWTSALTQMFLFANMFINSYFLPIYFQAVKGATPVMSGVYMLPTILSQLTTAVTSGILVGKLGYVIPWSLAAGVIASVGSGLLSRISPNTPTGEWIGFQILAGAGRGLGMQMPILAIQAALGPADLAIAVSLLSFAQYIGTSICLVLANTIFSEVLQADLPKYAPGASAPAIVAAGATAFRDFVAPEDLPGVLRAFAKGIDGTFYLATGMVAASLATAWGMGWTDIRAKKSAAKGEA